MTDQETYLVGLIKERDATIADLRAEVERLLAEVKHDVRDDTFRTTC